MPQLSQERDNRSTVLYSKYKDFFKKYFKKISIKYSNICYLYKNRLLAVRFFDYTRDCPTEIINCKQLREEYLQELKELQKYGMCTMCKIPFLQEKIIQTFILK
jgi:hypothetical protein